MLEEEEEEEAREEENIWLRSWDWVARFWRARVRGGVFLVVCAGVGGASSAIMCVRVW